MENLAGRTDCDKQIELELNRCVIKVIRLPAPMQREVPASIVGKLGSLNFERAWRYWAVNGLVPLKVALELYKDPVGRTDVRVAGHCGCPPPDKPWLTWRLPDGHRVFPVAEEAKIDKLIREGLPADIKDLCVFSDNPPLLEARAFVESYHIDTEIGLRLFADTIRKYGLDKIARDGAYAPRELAS